MMTCLARVVIRVFYNELFGFSWSWPGRLYDERECVTLFWSRRPKTTATTITFGPNAVLAWPPPHLDRVVVGVVVARKKKLRIVFLKVQQLPQQLPGINVAGAKGKRPPGEK